VSATVAIQIRVSVVQAKLLRKAARAQRRKLSAYVREAALRAAEYTLTTIPGPLEAGREA
jgi:uncharacterized protein (DUF1778 family)